MNAKPTPNYRQIRGSDITPPPELVQQWLHESVEDPADPGVHEPRVTGAPDAIWLVYGDLEDDDTHANCCKSGEVTWCEDAQFSADVRYTRTDLVAERVRAAVAAERERYASLLHAIRELPGSQCLLHENAEWLEIYRSRDKLCKSFMNPEGQ